MDRITHAPLQAGFQTPPAETLAIKELFIPLTDN